MILLSPVSSWIPGDSNQTCAFALRLNKSVIGVKLKILLAQRRLDLLERGEIELADLPLVAVGQLVVFDRRTDAQLAAVQHRLKIADAKARAIQRAQKL